MRKTLPVWIWLIVLPVACGRTIVDVTRPASHVRFTSNDATSVLTVTVADNPGSRQKGLSGIAELATGHGMAFVFAEPSTDRFWMKDTHIPLAVAFVGADGTVIAIRQMTPCTADPCRTYAAPAPYTLAVEAAPSWFGSHHITVGTRAALTP